MMYHPKFAPLKTSMAKILPFPEPSWRCRKRAIAAAAGDRQREFCGSRLCALHDLGR